MSCGQEKWLILPVGEFVAPSVEVREITSHGLALSRPRRGFESRWGHQQFGLRFYEVRGRKGRLAVRADVKKLLMATSIGAVQTHLKRSLTVSQILEGNAAVASQPPLCGCPGPCDCSIALLPAPKRKDEARKLGHQLLDKSSG